MELQGPGRYHDTFTKEILRFNRGGIVSYSLRIAEERRWLPGVPEANTFGC